MVEETVTELGIPGSPGVPASPGIPGCTVKDGVLGIEMPEEFALGFIPEAVEELDGTVADNCAD